MPTYAIGDIQGCHDELRALLEQIDFDSAVDRMWCVGDLVNRGPASAAVLRWAREAGEAVTAVLGNHDIHLLARAAGVRKRGRRDTLDDVLEARDAGELVDYVRHLPLYCEMDGYALVHAGIHPTWTLDDARARAREVEARLRADDWPSVIAELYNGRARTWSDSLRGAARARAIVGVLTRIRSVRADGSLCKHTGPPDDAPRGCLPWYERRAAGETTILFGHWSTLGLHFGPGCIGLDTGCVWGRSLTAVRLDDRAVFQVSAGVSRSRSSG